MATASLPQGAAPVPAATPGVDQRQASRDKRIDQGAACGALTARERQRLHHKQDRASRHIDRQKHDRRHGMR